MKKTFILSSLIVIILAIILWHLFWSNFTPEIFSSIGQFYAGTIGILITLVFAVIAFITYKKQVEYSQTQTEIGQKQNIENVFFKLFSIYENNVNTIDLTSHHGNSPHNLLIGRKVFKKLYEELNGRFVSNPDYYFMLVNDKEELKINILKVIQDSYKEFDDKFQPYIGYYFRNLYNTIKYVDEQSILNLSQKKFYIDMLRGQISSYELLLLFYNCLSYKGYEKFKPLLEKYGFLKHIIIIKDKLLDIKNNDHTIYYNKTAFED